MTIVGSTTDTNSLLQAAKRAPVLSAREEILKKIGAANPDQRSALEEKLSTLEQARESLEQARQDMAAARKEAARQKIARIKAQIQALQLAGGDAASRAKKIARMARELAAAVREYKAAGGSGSAAQGAQAVKPAATTTPVEASADVPAESSAIALSATLGSVLSQRSMKTQTHGTAAERKADKDFAEEARGLARQLKNLLRARSFFDRGADNAGLRTGRQDANRALSQAMRDIAGMGLSASASGAISFDVTI